MDNDNDSRIKDIIYKRKNGYDIVNDPESIASCKREQSRDIIDNSRLGSYDKYGNYIIIPEIKRELISLPKLVYNQYSTDGSKVFELKSSLPIFNDIFMKLVITGDIANLLVCEQVNREAGGYLEAYDEVVDSLAIGTEERMPQSLIFRTYNIFDNPDDFGKELKDSKFDNILTRKVYLSLLSKELKNVSTSDEKDAFKLMVSTLKQGGDYGNKVLNEFLGRLKDRPAIFEISKAENYNKAINEVLLSSLEIATTEQDKQDEDTRQVYLSVLRARDRNIDEGLSLANDRVSEEYVKHIVDKAKEDFIFGASEELSATDEFYSKLSEGSRTRHRTLDKPILKQGKESSQEPKTKEEKIKQILAGKNDKKTPKGVKLKASKGKKPVKKLKSNTKKKVSAKKKVARKKPKKAKLKSKKKVKKAKKKLGKKKSAKKKVRRKIAKKKLKGKKGKLKSKKKKLKKARKAKKGKLSVKKPGGKSGGKFSASPKKAKKKASGMSMAMKHNVLFSDEQSHVESSGTLTLRSDIGYKQNKEEKEDNENKPKIEKNNNIYVKIFNSKVGESSMRPKVTPTMDSKDKQVSGVSLDSGHDNEQISSSSIHISKSNESQQPSTASSSTLFERLQQNNQGQPEINSGLTRGQQVTESSKQSQTEASEVINNILKNNSQENLGEIINTLDSQPQDEESLLVDEQVVGPPLDEELEQPVPVWDENIEQFQDLDLQSTLGPASQSQPQPAQDANINLHELGLDQNLT